MIDDVYINENAAPELEPERQFFFRKKMQDIVLRENRRKAENSHIISQRSDAR